ncbi:MAG TPA: methylenetetrahydrofolate reductase [Candidatus Sulfotelmatobacter sp.]|nr:methylenetetrahydrofolate reductase [Candidatus Sulfotelmatobacter sp.]
MTISVLTCANVVKVQYTERVLAMDAATASPGIVELLRGYSIELNPGDSKTIQAAAERLEPGTEVSLAWIPDSDPLDMVAPAARLKRAGHFPMPHVGARHLESAEQLRRLAERLSDVGVDRILIIGGDRTKPAGPYDSSLAVMQTGVFQRVRISRMAVGGFPEGNPHIPDKILDEALAAKVSFARSEGLQLSIITQFCFNAEPVIEWVRGVRARGIDIPIRIGLAGPASLLTLMRYAVRCGIGNSLHVLTENPSFAKVLVERGPEPLIRGLAASIGGGDGRQLGIAGLHFYVFGGFRKTMDWIDAERSLRTPSAHT